MIVSQYTNMTWLVAVFYLGIAVGFCLHKVHGITIFPTVTDSSSTSCCKLPIGTRRRDFLLAPLSSSLQLTFVSSIAVLTTLLSPSQPCHALTPEQAATQYNTYAANYDVLDNGVVANEWLGIDVARKHMIQMAKGKILEIGVGTGMNLDKYDPEHIESLTLVDISDGMLQKTAKRVSTLQSNLPVGRIHMVKADATSELVPLFGSEQFDTVIDTFSLCVMGTEGANRCLHQLATVVKKSGRVLLLENSRSTNPLLGLYQDATAEPAAAVGGKGCLYNQDVRSMVQDTGRLEIIEETTYAAGLFRCFVCRSIC